MSVWLAIGLIVGGLVAVALVVLITDIARGDVGGHHTMARARRVLVVSTDDATSARADEFVAQQRAEYPKMQFFTLVHPDGQALYMVVEEVIERERPDAVVMARHSSEHHGSLVGTFGRLKEELRVPVDAIYLEPEDSR